jgi:hypothetical protein
MSAPETQTAQHIADIAVRVVTAENALQNRVVVRKGDGRFDSFLLRQ